MISNFPKIYVEYNTVNETWVGDIVKVDRVSPFSWIG
jgi:hypothetical protein